jgi:hypothetical protein
MKKPSSGMGRRIDLVRTDVSDERIFRVENPRARNQREQVSSAPSRNLRNMTPDLQGYAGQCSLGGPASFRPRHDPIPALACYLLAHLHSPFPSPLYRFPMWPTFPPFLFLYSWVFSTGGSVCIPCSCLFLARGFFCPEDGGDTILRNVGSHKIYTAPHPRSRHSSLNSA